VLYAFVGENVALLSHGCFKKDKVPRAEIKKAMRNLQRYMAGPEAHTYAEEI
jgi:hypothetical protein